MALVALGAVSVVEAWRLRDGWLGARLMPVRFNKVRAYPGPDAFWAFQNEALAKYLLLATKLGVRT
jgi:hypothetical protein